MASSFILQGLDENNDHLKYLNDVFSLSQIKKGIVATAFMNCKGAELLTEEIFTQKLENYKNVDIYVGIGNGVTSMQALRLLLKKEIYPFVVDTATNRFIFHSKVYVANNDDIARYVVGSANITSGGLTKNVESSIYSELDMKINKNQAYIQSIYDQFEKLKKNSPDNVFQLNSEDELNILIAQGLLVDESLQIPRTSIQKRSMEAGKIRSTMKLKTRKIINTSKMIKDRKKKTVQPKSNKTNDDTNIDIKNEYLLWESKELTERDLNIPHGKNTNPTGSMYLKKGNFKSIDQRTYFRNNIFKDEKWTKESDKKEICRCKFRFMIKNCNYGTYDLIISHDPRTDTKTFMQNNSVTSIHWGQAKDIVAKEELRGLIFRLYAKDENGVYTITIDEKE